MLLPCQIFFVNKWNSHYSLQVIRIVFHLFPKAHHSAKEVLYLKCYNKRKNTAFKLNELVKETERCKASAKAVWLSGIIEIFCKPLLTPNSSVSVILMGIQLMANSHPRCCRWRKLHVILPLQSLRQTYGGNVCGCIRTPQESSC